MTPRVKGANNNAHRDFKRSVIDTNFSKDNMKKNDKSFEKMVDRHIK